VRVTLCVVRWLSLLGRILAMVVIGAVLVEVGFGLSRSTGHPTPPCTHHVVTNCRLPGASINEIAFPHIAVALILAAIWSTLAILLARNWQHPPPDWLQSSGWHGDTFPVVGGTQPTVP
jgi:hypothetical protein